MELSHALDERSTLTLYEQLYRHIRDEITSGRIAAGEKLPSRRELAKSLSISGTTVDGAYQLLLQEGYLESRERSGCYARAVTPLSQIPPMPGQHQRAREKASAGAFDFSTSAIDAALFPYRTWMKLFRETLQSGPELLGRGDPKGDMELRLALCDFLYQQRGMRIVPDKLIIGAGADYLLSIALQLLPRGSCVAAEDPGYHGIHRSGERLGLPIRPVPMDGEGMLLPELRKSGATVCHVTPSHQFPLGLSMPIGRRSQLLRWAEEEAARYIIEDDYDSEYRHHSRPLPALQGLSGADKVIYVGTFSRSLAPSMRLAYLVLPDGLLKTYREGHFKCGETVSRFEQQTLARFIAEGHYQRHLRRAGNAYARRLEKLLALLKGIPGARVSGQEAGLHFLLQVPGLSEAQLIAGAAGAGIELKGLSEYCRMTKAPPSTLVLGFAGLGEDELEAAVAALRQAWGFTA